jgi:hypothetical protein
MLIKLLKPYASHLYLSDKNVQYCYITGDFEMALSQKRCSQVPSGQIGSKWEWYHWKALEKDMNRYKFLIF